MLKRIIVAGLWTATAMLPDHGPQLFPVDPSGRGGSVSYFGEEAVDGGLTLTASNGFFDSGSFVAREASPAPEAEQPFIPRHFEYLQPGKASGSARWHLWAEAAGELRVNAYLSVPEADAGTGWQIACDDQTIPVRAQASDGDTPQEWSVRFPVSQGKHTITLSATGPETPASTKVLRLDLTGAAALGAKVLRARWRPAAVHTAYSSSTCDETTLWVFESRSLNDSTSYSPINTPFGYFGTTFDPSSRKPRGFNFSMWATAKGKAVPALADMPHLIAAGNPLADFSGFGHEGSGVKLRGWDCLGWDPSSVIQALRVERRGDRDCYYGYFYHEPRERWILYAAGARPPRKKNAPAEFGRVTAFCEIPGPPDRQRSGDVERRIARRGWFLGTDQAWHAADVHSCKDKQSSSARRIAPAVDGWHVSLAGGLEIVEASAVQRLPEDRPTTLPEYLQSAKVDQLFEVPVRFESYPARDIRATSATVRYDLQGLGDDASAMLYFGTVDCLTFVARELHGTEKKGASADFYTDERTWARHTEPAPARKGMNRFELRDLEPATTYYYRAFVTHRDGKSWSYETGSFTTSP